MPTSFSSSIPVIIDLIKKENPNNILDIGVGRGKYGLLAKEYACPTWIDGVEAETAYITPIVKSIYDSLFIGDVRYMSIQNYDLTLMIDVIEHLEHEDGIALLNRVGTVIVSTPKEDYRIPYPDTPYENHISHWTLDDFKDFDFTDHSTHEATIVLIKRKRIE